MFQKWRQTKLQKRTHKKIKKERSVLHKQIIVGVVILFCVSLLVTGTWYGTRIESLQVTQVAVVGGFTIPHSEIEEKVRERLSGEYFLLIPHSFQSLYPRQAIIENIKSIPRIKNVHVELTEGQTVAVAFEEYRPGALWCLEHTAQECLFLDETGFAFAQAPTLTGSAFVRYVDLNHTPAKKEQAFDPEFMTQTKQFTKLLADNLDLYVTHVEKIQDLDIEYKVSGGGVLKVSQLVSVEDSFNNLKAILNSEDFIHLQNGAFQYIDLRFGDKIFLNEVELQEGVTTTTVTTTASST